MKMWVASLLAGVFTYFTGGSLFLLNLQHTIGLGGIGSGAALMAVGLGLLYKEGGTRVATSRSSGPSTRSPIPSIPGIRTLAAVGIVVLVGAGAFYATVHMVSTPGVVPSSAAPRTTFSSSQTFQSYTPTTYAPLIRTTSTCLAAPSGLCSTSTSAASTATATGTSTTSVAKSSSPVFIAFIDLYSGVASSSTSQGTAYLYLILVDDGPATEVHSITLSGGDLAKTPTVYICSSASSCSPFNSAEVDSWSATAYTSPTTAFYLGASLTHGESCNFEIAFANGQVIVGTIQAG